MKNLTIKLVLFIFILLGSQANSYAQSCVTITQPNVLSGSETHTNVSCFAGTNGTITITPAGGTAAYTYDWGGGVTTKDRTGLAAGTYTVTITDANLCTTTVSATITQPTALTFTTTQANVKCNGGSDASITVNGAGGVTPYTYSIDDSVTFPNTTGTFNSLGAGVYKIGIKDANGCVTKCL